MCLCMYVYNPFPLVLNPPPPDQIINISGSFFLGGGVFMIRVRSFPLILNLNPKIKATFFSIAKSMRFALKHYQSIAKN